MSESTLAQRIKAEFDSRSQRLNTAQQERAKESQDRDQRMGQFTKLCDELRAIWRPRLEEFARQFGDKIKVTPSITPSQREAKVAFLTELANMTLSLSVAASPDARKLVLDYDLLIIPIFFEYDRHARLEMPLDKIDRDAIGKWIDDRLISCVKAYLSIQDNEYYMKRAMVEDPITKARFLPDDAGAKLEHDGQTIYFKTEESMRQYKERLQIGQSAAPKETPAGAAKSGGQPPAGRAEESAPTVVTKIGQGRQEPAKP